MSKPTASSSATNAVKITDKTAQSLSVLTSELLPKIDVIINIVINEKIKAQNKEIIYFILFPPYCILTIVIIQLIIKTYKKFEKIFNY